MALKTLNTNHYALNAVSIYWDAMAGATADTGAPAVLGGYPERTVQAFSASWGGTTITMQGSNDPRVETDPANAVWFTLTDDGGNAITFTGNGAKTIVSCPRFVRPAVTVNGTGTGINIIINTTKWGN